MVRTGPSAAGVTIGSHDLAVHDCLTDDGQYGFSACSASGLLTRPTLSYDEITGPTAPS